MATAAKKAKAPARKKTAPKAARKKAPAKRKAPAKAAAKAKGSSTKARAKPAAQRVQPPEQPLMATLRAEHRHIGGVMKLFSENLNRIDQGEPVDTHVVFEVMDYMVQWPDRFHHPREDLIYGRVAELDASAADNVDSLQREHDEMAGKGRQVLADIEGWREGRVSGSVVVESGREYVRRMYDHMSSEEDLVFPQIESILTLEDWRELTEDDRLQPVNDPVFGPKVQREFRNLARRLRRTVRHSVERGAMAEWIGIEALMESLEVISMARDSAREVTGEHLRNALEEARLQLREAPLKAPLAITRNNARQTLRWAEEVLEISRETMGDLQRVNRDRLDRLKLVQRSG